MKAAAEIIPELLLEILNFLLLKPLLLTSYTN